MHHFEFLGDCLPLALRGLEGKQKMDFWISSYLRASDSLQMASPFFVSVFARSARFFLFSTFFRLSFRPVLPVNARHWSRKTLNARRTNEKNDDEEEEEIQLGKFGVPQRALLSREEEEGGRAWALPPLIPLIPLIPPTRFHSASNSASIPSSNSYG